jgi:hypothetical protein
MSTVQEIDLAFDMHLKFDMISVPISFEISQPTIEVKEGDDIAIPCEVYGLPEPTIQWYYDEENLAESLLGKLTSFSRLPIIHFSL